jgi:putative transposase
VIRLSVVELEEYDLTDNPHTLDLPKNHPVQAHRQQVLQAAYATHPERFVKGVPVMPELPTEVWMNKPQPEVTVPEPGIIGP